MNFLFNVGAEATQTNVSITKVTGFFLAHLEGSKFGFS